MLDDRSRRWFRWRWPRASWRSSAGGLRIVAPVRRTGGRALDHDPHDERRLPHRGARRRKGRRPRPPADTAGRARGGGARARAAAPRRRRDLPVAPEPRVPGHADDRRHEPPRRRCHARPHRRADARRLRQSRVRFGVVRHAIGRSRRVWRSPTSCWLSSNVAPGRCPDGRPRLIGVNVLEGEDHRRGRDPGRPLRAHDSDPAPGRRVPRSPRDGHRPHGRPAPARRRGRHRRHPLAEGRGRADLRGAARARPRPDRRRARARAHGAAARRRAAHLQGGRGRRDGVGDHAPPRIRRPRARRGVPARAGQRDPARPRGGRACRPVAGAARGGVLRQAGQAGLLSGRAPGDDPHAARRRGREGPRRGDVGRQLGDRPDARGVRRAAGRTPPSSMPARCASTTTCPRARRSRAATSRSSCSSPRRSTWSR